MPRVLVVDDNAGADNAGAAEALATGVGARRARHVGGGVKRNVEP